MQCGKFSRNTNHGGRISTEASFQSRRSFLAIDPNESMKFILLGIGILAFSVLSSRASAQEETQSLLLKDGTVVKGTVVSQSADTVEIVTSEGTKKIPKANIRRIRNVVSSSRTAPVDTVAQSAQQTSASRIEDAFYVWEITGGVSIPVGRFAQEDLSAIAFATTGVHVGIQYRVDLEKSLDVGVKQVFEYYGFDQDAFDRYVSAAARVESGSWYFWWSLADIGAHAPLDANQRLHLGALVGTGLGFSPRIRISDGLNSIEQGTAGAWAFSYGGEVSFYTRGLELEVRYLAATFDYPFGNTATGEILYRIKQPTGGIQITLGVAFL